MNLLILQVTKIELVMRQCVLNGLLGVGLVSMSQHSTR